jgi:predicted signal transduction protein with EAL and GGDEF domain
MSVGTKFLVVMIVVNLAIAMAGALIIPSLGSDRNIEDELRGRANRISMSVVMNEALVRLHREAVAVERLVYADEDPSAAITRLQRARGALRGQLQFLSGAEPAHVVNLQRIIDEEAPQLDALLAGPLTAEQARMLSAVAARFEERAGRELTSLLEENNTGGLNNALAEVRRLHGRLGLALAGVGGALALSLLLSTLAYRRLIRPLGDVTGALNAVLTGRPTVRRLEETQDELGDIVRAIHKLQAQAEHIRRVAFVDAGTGLPNRNRLDGELREVRRLRPIDGTHGLILIGIDTYSSIRSGFGFRMAEMMMRAASERLHGLDRMPTQVFRLEAEVLALLVDRGTAEAVTRVDLKRIAAEAMSRLSTPMEADDQRFLLNVAAGAALFPDDAKDAEEYVNVSVEALHQAQQEGLYHLRFGERGHTHRQRKHLALAEQIRLGLRQGEFVPFFQPIVDVAKRKVVGAEILVRWRQPDGRVVLPAEFLMVVEGSELIRDMTRTVLAQACRTVRGWSDQGLVLNVAFNLSPKLLTPGILDITREALRDSGLPAAQLVAEITETALFGSIDEATGILEDLKAMGLKLCLDDFGTGYSSLSHLYRFEIDRIKIDPMLTRAALQGDRAAEILRSMAELASRIGIALVAEGVESESDLERLQGLGCCLQQGFFYSRAMPAEQFVDWARRFEANSRVA